MQRLLVVLVPACSLVACRGSEVRPERPAPGDAMVFSEKVRRGFPVRWGKLQVHTPEGASYHFEGPHAQTPEFDLARYRTPLDSKIVSRRWEGNGGMYLANEQFFSGFGFYGDLVQAGYPVAHFQELAWVTAQEGYWYSRYTLRYVQAQSHMGIHMVHGPYWTLKAVEAYRRNRLLRDRGERVPSNKDILLGFFLPLYARRVGWPRVFEDANPTMLDYKSGDPHFTGPLPLTDTFADPQSDKTWGWGIPAYLIDWRGTRWDHDTMDTTINLGVVAQTMKKKVVWNRAFFRANHRGPSPDDPTREVDLLGNSGVEGFSGVALALGSLNTMLELKASLMADPAGRLGGVNPLRYDPADGLRYLPHEVRPELIMVGDMPERPNGYHATDRSSHLWDQVSLLWATADWYEQCFLFQSKPGTEVALFSYNPPVDGGLIEQRTFRVAQGLCALIVKNLESQHRGANGVLASHWTPDGGTGDEVAVQDAALAIVALLDCDWRLRAGGDPEADLRARARTLAAAQAEFLVRVQGEDGAFRERYGLDGSPRGATGRMVDQAFGVRALIAAWHLTADDRFLERARRTWDLLQQAYWHEPTGVYRTQVDRDVARYTPLNLAAMIGASREMILSTPAHQARPLLEQYVRFWIQAMDNSGMQMAEDFNTGEVSFGHSGLDDDGDGIPFPAHGDGPYGIAPVPAGEVAINLGEPGNAAFSAVPGHAHAPAGPVAATYAPGSIGATVRPGTEADDPGWVSRKPMRRWEGWTANLPASRPVPIGSEWSGREIFRRNCLACHGQRGEGIFGLDLKDDMFKFPLDEVVNTITKGRPEKGMPAWGEGHDDLNVRETADEVHPGNVLTEAEIDRVARYIQGELAEEYKRTLDQSAAGETGGGE